MPTFVMLRNEITSISRVPFLLPRTSKIVHCHARDSRFKSPTMLSIKQLSFPITIRVIARCFGVWSCKFVISPLKMMKTKMIRPKDFLRFKFVSIVLIVASSRITTMHFKVNRQNKSLYSAA